MKIAKTKKIKIRKRSNIKDRAWYWFSKYIRLRDCLLTTGTPDECYCVSCGVRCDKRHIQAGHCIGGRNDSILFSPKLVNGQCEDCNKSPEYGGLGGNYPAYHIWYIEKYGMEDFKEQERISNLEHKISTPELEELSDFYRLAFHRLEKEGLSDIDIV